MTLKIYGYAGCTTVNRAVSWAKAEGLSPDYSHFAKVPDLEQHLRGWIDAAGMDAVFNQKAQTFKKMPEPEQMAILHDDESRIAAMTADPRLIKRPVGTDGKTVLTGFKQEDWAAAFGGA